MCRLEYGKIICKLLNWNYKTCPNRWKSAVGFTEITTNSTPIIYVYSDQAFYVLGEI